MEMTKGARFEGPKTIQCADEASAEDGISCVCRSSSDCGGIWRSMKQRLEGHFEDKLPLARCFHTQP